MPQVGVVMMRVVVVRVMVVRIMVVRIMVVAVMVVIMVVGVVVVAGVMPPVPPVAVPVRSVAQAPAHLREGVEGVVVRGRHGGVGAAGGVVEGVAPP